MSGNGESMRKNKVADRRVIRTRRALSDGLLLLLRSKSWDDISIQEICDSANVGRSTFYVHFRGKEQLLAEGMDDLKCLLIANARSSTKSEFELLHGLMDHMVDQRLVFKALIGRRGGQAVVARFKGLTRQLIERELKQKGCSTSKSLWLSRYLSGGLVELMSWWVDAAKPPAIDDMKRRMDLLISQVLKVD